MSLREKYTHEEWDELEKISKSNKYEHISFAVEEENKIDLKKFNEKEKGSIPTSYNKFSLDEIGPYGKMAKNILWDFDVLKPGIKFEYPEINKDIANSFDWLKEKMYTSRKNNYILNEIAKKTRVKLNKGITPEVCIISGDDYNYLGRYGENPNSICIYGVTLKIHESLNQKKGNIDIY